MHVFDIRTLANFLREKLLCEHSRTYGLTNEEVKRS